MRTCGQDFVCYVEGGNVGRVLSVRHLTSFHLFLTSTALTLKNSKFRAHQNEFTQFHKSHQIILVCVFESQSNWPLPVLKGSIWSQSCPLGGSWADSAERSWSRQMQPATGPLAPWLTQLMLATTTHISSGAASYILTLWLYFTSC